MGGNEDEKRVFGSGGLKAEIADDEASSRGGGNRQWVEGKRRERKVMTSEEGDPRFH